MHGGTGKGSKYTVPGTKFYVQSVKMDWNYTCGNYCKLRLKPGARVKSLESPHWALRLVLVCCPRWSCFAREVFAGWSEIIEILSCFEKPTWSPGERSSATRSRSLAPAAAAANFRNGWRNDFRKEEFWKPQLFWRILEGVHAFFKILCVVASCVFHWQMKCFFFGKMTLFLFPCRPCKWYTFALSQKRAVRHPLKTCLECCGFCTTAYRGFSYGEAFYSLFGCWKALNRFIEWIGSLV